ncbi:hypothetical protein QBC46DRAFT_59027 [Diplogelasinospora grovesii]|uniref:WW domain-containing protein n=1 Tax=Diplogelasinospora grovesii TaxID=303347 RepID=A0AAN6S003_9PEZI|nr:hypothetical protein QBC46DRAFT_59027 [Diplogelasinospora grovesii]
MSTPTEPPPSYQQATGSSAASSGPSRQQGQHLEVPGERNGIPHEARRSMEDELRPLPKGWVRTFDPENRHQFFVDTTADPPRSIWHHPYDDEQYLSTLSPAERERIRNLHNPPPGKPDDHAAGQSGYPTDEDDAAHHPAGPSGDGAHDGGDKRSLGRRLKDKLTGTTHEQRTAERERQEKAERELYRQHQIFRRGLAAAMDTGKPQLLGADDDGVNVYLEPPGSRFPGVIDVRRLSPYMTEVSYAEQRRPGPPGRYVRPDGEMGYYPGSGYYGSGSGPYRSWDRPYGAYGRPGYGYGYGGYGYGYGGRGGMALPMMAPLFGGMMLSGLLF